MNVYSISTLSCNLSTLSGIYQFNLEFINLIWNVSTRDSRINGVLHGVLLGHFWSTFGALWSTFGALLVHFWSTFGILLEYFLGNFGVLLEYFWSTVCLDGMIL